MSTRSGRVFSLYVNTTFPEQGLAKCDGLPFNAVHPSVLMQPSPKCGCAACCPSPDLRWEPATCACGGVCYTWKGAYSPYYPPPPCACLASCNAAHWSPRTPQYSPNTPPAQYDPVSPSYQPSSPAYTPMEASGCRVCNGTPDQGGDMCEAHQREWDEEYAKWEARQ